MKKKLVYVICMILLASFPVSCVFLVPRAPYPNMERKVEILNRVEGVTYIDDANPNISEVEYLELLDSQHYFAKSDGTYRMNFKYSFENNLYNIIIMVSSLEEFSSHHTQTIDDFDEIYKDYHFYSRNYEVDDYVIGEELFCLIGNYIYQIDSCFLIDELTQTEKIERIEKNREVTLQLLYELVDNFIQKEG